ncbi:MAG: cytochrome c biogenesis factor [Erythrobacter sp. RIFCSPHIGHO2_12_FULL_63_10]|nr:MAG: cytochrome c biogenesis factor [Erythrobacter sp. RIFCSPHIGHO2_12_FULL_63_10]
MTGWIAIIALVLAAFLVAALVLKLERRSWTTLGAVLTFGLAGYALQGSPDQPSAAKQITSVTAQSGEAMIAARRSLFDPAQPVPSYLMISDGFARQGRYMEAAQLLRSGLAANPGHGEGWLALANALVEHANGQVTPASLMAFGKAEAAMPGHPGPAYFLGVALLRTGMPLEARRVWAALLDASPPDAPWREDLAARIGQLDAMLAQMPAAGQ